ncbi:SusD/RagB family nutrient-binding outer membrane lipoprotein [Elizabethkingia anophelis]|uniref:SusD/RagB family nutrient-binding outer membrane lipoprotein n=1 Tax=Elizabethkingia anophelis TaxID=1117645 RepID=UPI0021A6587F|nr:SusD/RagB family nutrient-binding outer membrane lipoprotein [Elizabethkingia anophelis]MCT4274770.1 SusD/RagB family nutrient-binding outer membrane lipoprotein [Elizabethkingia anophelis]MCT4278862.1 SusD/RagB family nutrient-binding outer membrane lipoprotein [Elizabethkingia anophelis]
MNKIILYTLFVLLFCVASCTRGFEDINTNPNSVGTPNPDFVFSKSQLDGLNNNYFYTSILQCGQMIQHYASYKEASGVGDKYLDNEVYYSAYFSQAYPNAINQITLVINELKKDPKNINKLNTARIWKVYLYHRITDLYGDIPYTEAAKAYSDKIFLPKYDSQELIYKDMLKELEEAATALDASKTGFGKADLIYDGDINKWKKFAYSLMLRLGMRLTKVDQNLSKEWVTKAINGGVILNSADNAMMRYTDGPNDFNRNPSAFDPIRWDFSRGSNGRTNNEGGKLSKTFIDFLKSTADPRISVYSGVWEGSVQNTAPAVQKGFPNGTNVAPSPAEQATYSEPNQSTVLRMDAPMLLLGNVETQLYLAEASLRGWYGEAARTLYEKAVKASFLNMGIYGASYAISDAAPYLTANPFKDAGTFEEKMNQIHTQLWVGLFVDEQEIYANWRRTGYPQLTPVNFPGNVTNGTIPRRIKYPTSEYSVNSSNLAKALERQGRDVFTTRIWWDK